MYSGTNGILLTVCTLSKSSFENMPFFWLTCNLYQRRKIAKFTTVFQSVLFKLFRLSNSSSEMVVILNQLCLGVTLRKLLLFEDFIQIAKVFSSIRLFIDFFSKISQMVDRERDKLLYLQFIEIILLIISDFLNFRKQFVLYNFGKFLFSCLVSINDLGCENP